MNDTRPFNEMIYSQDDIISGVRKNEHVATQSAGNAWQNHPERMQTAANTNNEVRLFVATTANQLQCKGYFAEKTLVKETWTDADGKQVITYTNKDGQIVMQKKGNGETYYVYNLLGQLAFVLPPMLSSLLSCGTYSLDDEQIKRYAYCYQYDGMGNCVYKRLPGCEPIRMLYDKANRLVCSVDGEQRKHDKATVYMYDQLGRMVYTLENEVQDCDHFTDELETFVSNTQAVEQCFNDYAIAHELADTHYSNSFITQSVGQTIHSVNYYDDYTFLKYSQHKDSLQYDNIQEAIFGSLHNNATGRLTGSRTYLLNDDNTYIETAYYYDYRGRVIQQRSTNHFGGYDIIYTAYNFSGLPTQVLTIKSTNMDITTRERYTYTYDHALRLIATAYQLNDDSPTVLNTMRYDELGRLAIKTIYNSIDSVAYQYDIHNQLTHIQTGSGFTENLYYNTSIPILPGSAPLYNGNISALTWTYGSQTNGYIYTYDNQNRLVSNYSVLNGAWAEKKYSENFTYDLNGNITALERWNAVDVLDDLYMTYLGNQLTAVDKDSLTKPSYNDKFYQNHEKEADIEMLYDKNGNLCADLDRKICSIQYNSLNLPAKIQFSNGNQIAITYDATGHKITTTYYTRKSTTTVPFGNILNPENNLADYHVAQYAYHGNIVYKCTNPDKSQQDPNAECAQHLLLNGTWLIDFIHNIEGYTRYYTPTEHYAFYYIKDHLGNVRETWINPWNDYKECVQRMQYYPSGLPWDTSQNPSEQPYKYNGKEFIEMHGLDNYDSEARYYYPAIARATTMDPLCEKYYDISPYA